MSSSTNCPILRRTRQHLRSVVINRSALSASMVITRPRTPKLPSPSPRKIASSFPPSAERTHPYAASRQHPNPRTASRQPPSDLFLLVSPSAGFALV
ncbi:UNVERIFIED_CONTAM: hypothetical protein Slati_1777700 [Sesamum latifolium]|uniref:Uncharacterized protein n=1 Tax=Sesamum latifolium TaxID=2727402 RepID=A0AAW2WYH1_9LAMI